LISCALVELFDRDEAISNLLSDLTTKLQCLEKHLYTYLEVSMSNLSFRGGSQASLIRTHIGMDWRSPRAMRRMRYWILWILSHKPLLLPRSNIWAPYS